MGDIISGIPSSQPPSKEKKFPLSVKDILEIANYARDNNVRGLDLELYVKSYLFDAITNKQ